MSALPRCEAVENYRDLVKRIHEHHLRGQDDADTNALYDDADYWWWRMTPTEREAMDAWVRDYV